jgi:predicted MFS family arabinose efflux permease
VRDDGAAGRWGPVVAYAALSGANQMLWLTYTPITTDAAHHYGVSKGAIGWLAEIFPLLYVVLAVPTGRLIDRSLPRWLAVGALLTGAGGLLRLVGDDYWPVLAGQVLIAVGQPFVLNAVTRMSRSYLRAEDRPTGIAVSSAGVFGGMLLALALGAGFGGGHIRALLVVQAVLAGAAALALVLALRRPGPFADADVVGAGPPLRVVWRDPYLRRLLGLVCVGFGVFIALTTWLQALLDPAGVSETVAGAMLLVMVVAGVAGSALLPPVLARRRRELTFVLVSVLVTAAGLIALAVAPGRGTGFVVCAAVGLLLLTDLPVVLELAERRAGAAGGTASALVWLAGNAAGLVTALAVQVLVDHPGVAFGFLAAVNLLALPLLAALRRAGDGPVSRRRASSGRASSSSATGPG